MSGKDYYPPPGQAEPTSGDTSVTDVQSSRPTTPRQQNVPSAQRHNNMPVNKQTVPQQHVQSNQKPMPPQMQFGQQQQYNQQQYYQQQPMPQQQYQQQYAQPMAQQQYAQPVPQQQYAQPVPQQQYAQPIPQQQYAQPMPQQYYAQPIPQQATPQYYNNVQPVPGQMMVPSPVPIMSAPIQPWTTGLFDCAEDAENCLITFFCPCITLGQVAEITDSGRTTCSTAAIVYSLLLYFTGFQWIYSMMYRSRLRALYSLQEDPCHDCLVHFFCDPCALCQEYRELQNRGFNMQLGWLGNVQLQAQRQAAATTAPVPVQGMTR